MVSAPCWLRPQPVRSVLSPQLSADIWPLSLEGGGDGFSSVLAAPTACTVFRLGALSYASSARP